MKRSAFPKFAAVRPGAHAGPSASAQARVAAAAALNALLAPWRRRPAWLVLMLVLMYWFWW